MAFRNTLAVFAFAGSALAQSTTSPPVVTITSGEPSCYPLYECCTQTARAEVCGGVLENCIATSSIALLDYSAYTVATCAPQEPCSSSMLECIVSGFTATVPGATSCGSSYSSCLAAKTASSVLATPTTTVLPVTTPSTSTSLLPVTPPSTSKTTTSLLPVTPPTSSKSTSKSTTSLLPVTPSSATGTGVVYTTKVVTSYTTYCPSPTVISINPSKTITVTSATTLTITDCPCTISSIVTPKASSKSSKAAASSAKASSKVVKPSGSGSATPPAQSKASSPTAGTTTSTALAVSSTSPVPYQGAAGAIVEQMAPIVGAAAAVAAVLLA